MAISEAQKKAKEKYRKKNPEKARYNSYKGTAKTFIRNYATLKDVEELQILLDERKEEIQRG